VLNISTQRLYFSTHPHARKEYKGGGGRGGGGAKMELKHTNIYTQHFLPNKHNTKYTHIYIAITTTTTNNKNKKGCVTLWACHLH
jgi:hypothetical protein